MVKGKKKYNPSTKGYKIDIFANGIYVASTDHKKTCKEAIARFIELEPSFSKVKNIKAFFDRS